jgi:hypothetical protein
MLKIEHKRGDTFAPSAQYLNADGTPASLVGYAIKSQLRDSGGNLVQEFAFNITNAALGEYAFLPVDTSAWPVSTMQMDIQYTQNGMVISTETIELSIVRKVTRP